MTTVDGSTTEPAMAPGPGEQQTAAELRKLWRRGWVLVNQVMLTRPDIDHVLVGPGGVLAIQSEWSTDSWRPDDSRLSSVARRARHNALRLTLWHGLRPAKVGTVESAVVLWGPGASELLAPFDLGGTLVLPGHCLPAWRARLGDDRLTSQQVDAAWRALHTRSRKRAAVSDHDSAPGVDGVESLQLAALHRVASVGDGR